MRIVLDTNVLVSGLIQPFGPSGQIVRLVSSGDLTLCHDPRILAEYEDVLLRDKFGFDPDRVDTLLEQVRAGGIPIAAYPLAVRLPDPDDEPFLEVALAGRAPFLITGNIKHYPVGAWREVEVLSPRSFLERYRGSVG